MKKIIRLFACLLSAVMFNTVATAQQQPTNGGFENWDNIGSDNREPSNWNSFKTADCHLGAFTCPFAMERRLDRETDIRPGSAGEYSVRIFSTSAVGIIANGNLTTGMINMGSISPSDPSNHNYTRRDDANFNMPFTNIPDSLVVWVKFNAANSGSLARISTSIHDDYNYRDPEDATASSHVVGKATLNYPPTNGEWVRKSIPFDYNFPANDAQYVLITFTTNMTPGGGDENDEVFIDDLEFIYNPNTVTITPVTDQYLLVDEAGTVLTATELANAASQDATITREWKFSTTSGSGYASFSSPETGATYTPQFNATGTYYVICESTFGGETVTSDEVAIHVSETIPNIATVTPNATQNLDVNESGTTLTVAETPAAASSREWKYSTTSGSGYMSFLSDEFATSYTPVFASSGTYYVICESNFAGEIVTSNEVQINVTSTSGISEFEESDIVVYQNNEKLYLDLTNSSFKGEKVSIYTVDGRQVKETAVTSNAVTAINIDFPNGIYLVVVQSANASSQQKIFIR